jgi:hypothetical protein
MAKTQAKDNKIRCPHIIACEGPDDEKYLCYFLQPLITRDDRYDQIQIMSAGGKDELPPLIKMLPSLPGFSIVKTLTILRDADEEAQAAEYSVQNLLKAANFAVPKSQCEPCRPRDKENNVITGYALFPFFNTEKGALEDLCLKTLAGDNAEKMLGIVDCAVSRVTKEFGELKWLHKNKLHTYLSLTNAFVTCKLGEAAQRNAYNFDARELEPLKKLLQSMLDAAQAVGTTYSPRRYER